MKNRETINLVQTLFNISSGEMKQQENLETFAHLL